MYVAVRDRNWGTVPATLSDVQISARADSFEISYVATHKQKEIEFVWRGHIRGASDGTIAFSMDGEVRSTFLRNRIGICVLHPAACAGLPCEVEHSNGEVERGAFPLYISPHQPFFDIRSISHEPVSGVRAAVRFEGDVFEMEDQRNWTDASYKTYCTPISEPYPVQVKEGTRIQQQVTLSLTGQTSDTAAPVARPAHALTLTSEPPGRLPALGVSVASHSEPLREMELERLRALNLSHLHVSLHLAREDYAETWERTVREAEALGVPLLVSLLLGPAPEREVHDLAERLRALRPEVVAWLVFREGEPTTLVEWLDLVAQHVRDLYPDAPIGGGTDLYFTHLNRERPPTGALDPVSYSINPQVHAFDNLSLVETLEAQPITVESARQFIGDAAVYVTPVTLRPRHNPDATDTASAADPKELPAQVDARQATLLGAGWTLGSIAQLASSGVSRATYYETTGWRGVMETSEGSPLPEQFPHLPGAVFPVYHVLADIGEMSGADALPLASGAPLVLTGVVLKTESRVRVLVANLSDQALDVEIRAGIPTARVRKLQEGNVLAALQAPEEYRAHQGELLEARDGALRLHLPPYALTRLDSVDGEDTP